VLFSRLCGRLDKATAITAAAHKLARLIHAMLTKGTEYVDKGQEYYEEHYRQRVVYNLTKKAAAMGFVLIPAREKIIEIQS
jgi:hypothetical protein